MPHLNPGDLFADRYLIIEQKGKGGMALVYKVEDTYLECRGQPQLRALKLLKLPEDASLHIEFICRFRSEASVMIALTADHCRHIVQFIDYGETFNGMPYLIMEYLEGQTLERYLRVDGDKSQRRALRPIVAIDIVAQIGDALTVLHNHREHFVHRDISPQNIFMCSGTPDVAVDGYTKRFVKLLDFGIAKSLTQRHSELTRVGFTVGKPGYMAPEQYISPERVSAKTDQWALGLIAYEMMTGENAFVFPGESQLHPYVLLQRIRERVLREDPLSRPVAQALPVAVRGALARALHRDQTQRFGSVGELVQALQHAMEPPTVLLHSGARRGQSSTPAVAPGSGADSYAWLLGAAPPARGLAPSPGAASARLSSGGASELLDAKASIPGAESQLPMFLALGGVGLLCLLLASSFFGEVGGPLGCERAVHPDRASAGPTLDRTLSPEQRAPLQPGAARGAAH